MNSRLALARAVTVAVRYLAIRRQFRNPDSTDPSGAESPVLDYSTVQIRVLPLLATVFALHYTGKAMWRLYESTRSEHSLNVDNNQLQELHSTSAGLKSLATDLSANGIETCRRAMGGHGFGGATGLIQINADWLAKPTVEGDNWMITQQAARYLIKMVDRVVQNPEQPGTSHTETCLRNFLRNKTRPVAHRIFETDEAIVHAFEDRVSHLAWESHQLLHIQKQPWNDLLIRFHSLSGAYSQALLVRNFFEALQTLDLDSEVSDVMTALFRLFSLYTLNAECRQFERAGVISPDDVDRLYKEILHLMRLIRPHAVRLVDSFALPDYLLDSALGRYDGKVYEELFHRAHKLNPLNRETFNPDYRTNEIVMGSGDMDRILAKI